MHSTDSSAGAHDSQICPVYPWCDIPHAVYGIDPRETGIEHRSTPYALRLPDGTELISFGVEDGRDGKPTAWIISSSDATNLDAAQLADTITTLRRSLTDMIRLQAQLAASEQQWYRQAAERTRGD